MSIIFTGLQVSDSVGGYAVNSRAPVRVATTANGVLSTDYENGDVIDDITLATGDRILLKDQTTQTQNGIYVVQASGVPIRTADLDTGNSANTLEVWVKEGTVNCTTAWVCTAVSGSDVVGTDNLTFAQSDVRSTLAVDRGGTGNTTFTSNGVLLGDGTNAVTHSKQAPTGVFVGTSDTQTMTNKTLTTPIIASISNTGLLTLPTSTDTLVGRDTTDTLTNKTLTLPIVSSISNTGTVSFPTSTDTLVGRATTDTLTNKTWGDNLDMNNFKIVNLGVATSDTDVVNKGYVDSVAQGLSVKKPVRLASTDDLDSNGSISGLATYTNTGGASGRGQITATLSFSDTFTIDGINLGAADDNTRILLKDQSTAESNGIWVTTVSGTNLTLDRADDYDEDDEVSSGDFFFVTEGSTQADNGYVLSTDGDIIIGGASGTGLAYSQFSGTGQIAAGDGLSKSGNVMDVDLKTNGGLVLEATQIALDLSATSITGTLAVVNGGTGVTTLTSNGVLVGTGTSAVSTTKVAPAGVFVGTTDAQTMTNKTLTTPIISSISNTGLLTLPTSTDTLVGRDTTDTLTNKTLTTPVIATIVNTGTLTLPTSTDTIVGRNTTDTLTNKTLTIPIISSISNTGTLTLPTSTDTLVGRATTDTMTNKTLMAPKLGTSLLDTNGNELFVLTATSSAVNELSYANAATATNPSFSASGDDTNVGIDFASKGTGSFNFSAGSASASAAIRLEDNTGGEYVGIDVPATVSASYTMTLPSAVGTVGQILKLSDGAGNLEFATGLRSNYMIQSNQIAANTISLQSVAYFAWDQSEYSTYTAGKVIFWHDVGADNDLTVELYDGTSAIGTLTVSAATSAGIGTFTITNPTSDKKLQLRVKKSAAGGINPTVYGVQLEFTS